MIKVEHDGCEKGLWKERCFWFAKKDVAVCRDCAKNAEAEDVPTKKKRCRREDIATKRD